MEFRPSRTIYYQSVIQPDRFYIETGYEPENQNYQRNQSNSHRAMLWGWRLSLCALLAEKWARD